MIRPPSNQRPYDDFYSGDPAFVQLDANADEAAIESYRTKLRVARETGDWSALRIEGLTPTKFVMKPLPETLALKLGDDIDATLIGKRVLHSIVFRACIQSIVNGGPDLDAHTISPTLHPAYGVMASEATVNILGSIDPGIVPELGAAVIARRGTPPKS